MLLHGGVRHLFNVLRKFGNCPNSRLSVSHLNHRSLLKLTGRDALSFLQGLLSNDVSVLESSSTHLSQSLHAYLLNPYGRIVYDLILYGSTAEEERCILLECDRRIVSELGRILRRYVLRKNVNIQNDDRGLFALLPSSESEFQVKNSLEIYADPRSPSLGWRLICDVAKMNSMGGVKSVDLQEYHRKRCMLGIPEGIDDLPPGACFPFESNGDYLNAISFDKGCYIGQELTARTYHTGVVRKRLFPIVFDSMDEVFLEQVRAGSHVLMTFQNEYMGKVRNLYSSVGLALVNVDKALTKARVYVQLTEQIVIAASVKIPCWFRQPGTEQVHA
ncbi:unnamed protein product [Soboliphyme baturini]|uniref:GCV_T domain-containing protein n=1 Tax=Soboliphyme baturini TaxID=241478 RepID=A0A183IQ53_9BILA|nr:unnamed protein product [Soboliphyme baturini]